METWQKSPYWTRANRELQVQLVWDALFTFAPLSVVNFVISNVFTLMQKKKLYLYTTQVWATLNCSASYFTGFQNSFNTASQLCYCALTLSNISRVWAADKQNLVRDSIRGVAGNPTTTTAMFLFNISRPNALKKENGFLFYNQRPTKKLAHLT